MSKDSNQSGQSFPKEVTPKLDSSPKTVSERTRFLINIMRRAYHRRPQGVKGGVYVISLFLIYFPWLAFRLYLRVFLIWPLASWRIRIVAKWTGGHVRIVTKWICIKRSAIFALHRTQIRRDKRSPLDRTLSLSVCNGETHNVSILLRRGANPSETLQTRTPILLFAVRARQHEIVQLLLEAGASTDACDPASKAPAIWFAARKNDMTMIHLLLKYGANVDAHGITGHTALMEAAALGNTEMVRALLTAGADQSKRDLCGLSARDRAATKQQDHIVKLFAVHQTNEV